MMDKESYDTVRGIEALAQTLAGLHRLQEARYQAGRRKERLGEFLLLGTFYLDDCGNFMRCKIERDDKLLGRDQIRPVVTKEGLFSTFTDVRIESRLAAHLPREEDECDHCRGTWSSETIHDLLPVTARKVQVYRHRRCHELVKARDSRKYFSGVATEAGYEDLLLEAVPNQYCRPCEWCSPWYKLRLVVGDVVMGWRKHVISIDWHETGVALPDLFKADNVTQEPHLVHAGGRQDAVRYLGMLREQGLR
jgi:hypothetical protein